MDFFSAYSEVFYSLWATTTETEIEIDVNKLIISKLDEIQHAIAGLVQKVQQVYDKLALYVECASARENKHEDTKT